MTSDFGAPGNTYGWARSGMEFGNPDTHCKFWTTGDEPFEGTQASLSIDTDKPFSPWDFLMTSCSKALPVWCVSDPVQSVPAEAVFCSSFEGCPTE